MTVSLYELFLVSIIGQGLFLILAIQYIPKKHTGANRAMQGLLAIYTFYLLERVVITHVDSDLLFRYGYVKNTLYLFIGPLIYTYIRRLLFSKNGNYRLGHYHFLPALLYIIYSLFHSLFVNSIVDIDRYRTILLFWIEVTFFISISVYVLLSARLLNYYLSNEKRELSVQQPITRYIGFLLVGLFVYLVFWFLGILERFVINLWLDMSMIYDVSCLIFGVQIYIVGFYHLRHPDLFKIQFPAKEKDLLKKKNAIDATEIAEIKKSVAHFFDEVKGYRRPELSLSILAREIGTTTNKLSWVLNHVFEKSFYELVNTYRIHDFLQRIDANEHREFTVVSIALEVGFKSKSTFYKTFKEMTHFTPTEYIKNMRQTAAQTE